MNRNLTEKQLRQESDYCSITMGRSDSYFSLGFQPAFLDRTTGYVYLSRFANGELAPVHFLSCLPDMIVTRRAPTGEVCSVSDVVISGYAWDGRFFSRAEVMALSSEFH